MMRPYKTIRMKRTNYILSLLYLLLLLTTACSQEELVQMPSVSDQVELTIRTHVPEMEVGSRTAITENITTITALAFDVKTNESVLIKKVDATLSNNNDTTGTLRITVPKRTRMIHFLTNGDAADVTDIATLKSKKITDVSNMHYWGMLTFADAEALNANNLSLTLYRNMAKVVLELGEGLTGTIAGFVNYNTSGMLVPNEYQVGNTPTIPDDVQTLSHQQSDLGNVHYLFEHANVKGNNPIYAICKIGEKYYKIAFANANKEYFPLVRNHQYTIKINSLTAEGKSYEDAANPNNEPINDATVVVDALLGVTPSTNELYYGLEKSMTVTVKVPEGVSSLTITADNFDISTESDKVTEKSGNTYTVTSAGDVVFTFTLKDASYNDNQAVNIQFTGTASDGYKVTNPEAINVTLKQKKNVQLVIEVVDEEPNNPSMAYGPKSIEDLQVKVTIPAGVTSLTFNSDKFEIASFSDLPSEGDVNYLSGSGNSYTVNHQGEESITLPFRLRLKDDASGSYQLTFNGTGEYINDTNASKSVTLNQRDPDDSNIYWEGYLPLNQSDNTSKITIPKNDLTVGTTLRIDGEINANNQALALLNDWEQFVPDDMEYTSLPVEVPLTQEFINTINNNLIITGRMTPGLIMKKISFVPPSQTVQITAVPTPVQNPTLYYSTNAVSDLIVNVTIPKEVTTLTFESAYFDAEVVGDLYEATNGGYTINHVNDTTITTRLRLKNTMKQATNSASFTFGGTSTINNVVVESAVVNKITLQQNGDEYVRWQGDASLNWDASGSAVQIPLPYSWFEGIAAGSTLRVDYQTTDNDGGSALIQFTEVKSSDWTEYAYVFDELYEQRDGKEWGLNYNKDTHSGSIYSKTTIDLKLTQEILTQMGQNVTNNLSEEYAVMALQGQNVRIKKISVIPNTGGNNENVIFQYDFADVNLPTEFNISGGTCQPINGSLVFTASSQGAEDYSNQITITNISFEENTVYTLTFKVKSNVTDNSNNGLFIGFDNPNDSFSWCGTFTNNGTNVKLVESNEFTEISLTATATATVTNGRLFFNLGHLGACIINIDDLKLVKND